MREKRKVRLGREHIDLTIHLHIDEFNQVVRAVHGVVDQSESLSLDNAEDREVLKNRLLKSLGCVVPRGSMRL
jgi:hypothetical protein